jgi:peptide chain release factor subunit 3
MMLSELSVPHLSPCLARYLFVDSTFPFFANPLFFFLLHSTQTDSLIMNHKANEWKPSAAAATWAPPTAPPPRVPTPPPPAAATWAAPTAPPPRVPTPPPQAAPAPVKQESSGSQIDVDESDPLWQVVLKISKGDREKAYKMLNDPDSLTQYPEVVALLASTDVDMEEDDGGDEITTDLVAETEKMSVADTPPAAAASKKEEPEAMEEDEVPAKKTVVKTGDPREHLNLVFIGHVDAGKSTLSGNILYLTDNVDKRTIERYEKEAKERNRESWFLAFIMDTNEEERAKGKTVEVGKAHLETEFKRYTILDAPGHKNYVPNMIQGASQADVGLLVISARKGEFEAGFDRGGQSREHAMLAKTLGVSFLVVVVNKMDEPTVQWRKERYDEIVTKLRPFLKSCGFVIKTEVKFIPVSGLGGANVKDEVDPSICSWWKDCYTNGDNNTTSKTLLSLLDTLEIKGRDPNAPLRVPILDRYTDRGTIAMGKVESGVLRPGMKVTVMPTKNVYKIDEVWVNEDSVDGARPGENVLIKIAGAKTEDIRKGFIICGNPPCRAVDKIICQIAIADLPDNAIMTAGYKCMFHAHTEEEECTVVKIFETTNSKGQVVKSPRYATEGMRAIVMLQLAQTVPLETYDTAAFLGRFTLRTEGRTVAIGKITKLPPSSN